MALIYTGGPYVNTTAVVSTPDDLLNALQTNLTGAGWTATAFNESWEFQFTGQPAPGGTITLAGVVYTAVAALGGANDFLIGPTALQTYRNLQAAVNGLPGLGTVYGVGTSPNPTATILSVTNDGYVLVSKITPGTYAAALALTNTVTFTTTGFMRGFIFTPPASTQGLQWSVIGAWGEVAGGADQVRMYISQPSLVARSYHFPETNATVVNSDLNGDRLKIAPATSYRIQASPGYLFVYVDGISAAGCQFKFWGGGVAYVSSPSSLGVTVTGVASNGGLVQITTSAPHGLVTGDSVCCRGVSGVQNANFTGVVTVNTATIFTFDLATFTGAYVSGGIVGKVNGAGSGSIAEFIWSAYGQGGLPYCWFRGSLTPGTTGTGSNHAAIVNGLAFNSAANGWGQGSPDIYSLVRASPGALTNGVHYAGGYIATEPIIGSGNAPGSPNLVIGQLFDMAIVPAPITRDTAATFDGFPFWNITDLNSGLAPPSAVKVPGSVLVRVG